MCWSLEDEVRWIWSGGRKTPVASCSIFSARLPSTSTTTRSIVHICLEVGAVTYESTTTTASQSSSVRATWMMSSLTATSGPPRLQHPRRRTSAGPRQCLREFVLSLHKPQPRRRRQCRW
ncbi:hypothetical protein GUJ93_ZPchr0002g24246 [Zizania palustris]|uniref:Uncharacterized protein n=1 Tax=Zizania palustris TaxID=103762 RepID=A0A8J5VB59_ZIZPA|nr:hypothetical protein GUJ93_ZPchr0002g24246 [Zizania palustris]